MVLGVDVERHGGGGGITVDIGENFIVKTRHDVAAIATLQAKPGSVNMGRESLIQFSTSRE
ncbi:uncharacterized protein G2W53_028324 [Senna tora]|uniref:Uncharacterized protein n=1 Tax=Senna tora TaxID=362788 RepID=A0A834W8N3_9FABA|nr:uncharacterized protein G2W53_028324 [Senna tora]